MPELRLGDRTLVAASGSNLLDTLLAAGVAVPYSCRAGSCHACLVRCRGELAVARPDALDAAQRAQGWRLACQCRVQGDLDVELFDPIRDGRPAQVQTVDWLSERVLRLRLLPERPLRYAAGQHLLLWSAEGVARPYSLASTPAEAPWLEFHLDCLPGGAFSEAARRLQPGDVLRLGELQGGSLHYDPAWSERPLWLLAAGTGLAPLWGILRDALRQHHQGPIRVIHIADEAVGHYLAEPLRALAEAHSNVDVLLPSAADQAAVLAGLRLASRQTLSLLCGSPASVDAFARRLFLLGVPRNQVLADTYLPHA